MEKPDTLTSNLCDIRAEPRVLGMGAHNKRSRSVAMWLLAGCFTYTATRLYRLLSPVISCIKDYFLWMFYECETERLYVFSLMYVWTPIDHHLNLLLHYN